MGAVEHCDILAAEHGDRSGFPGGQLAVAVSHVGIGARKLRGLPRAFEKEDIPAGAEAVGHRDITAVVAGKLAVLRHIREHLHGSDRLFAVDVAAGLGIVLVRDLAAVRPDVRQDVPAGERGLVKTPNRLSGAVLPGDRRDCFHKFVHRRGNGDAGLFESLFVIKEDLRIGVERHCVVVSGDEAGAHGALQQVGGDGIKIGHFLVQRGENAHLLEFGHPRDIQTRHIRQRVGLRADEDLIMEVRPLVRDGVDLDPGILFLKSGDENIHKSFVLCRLGAVVMPEVDRNGFGFCAACRRFFGGLRRRNGAGARRFVRSARSECR